MPLATEPINMNLPNSLGLTSNVGRAERQTDVTVWLVMAD
jgi:hypothetical protein